MSDVIKRLCVRCMPAVYAWADAVPGLTLSEAEYLLMPFVTDGLSACVVYEKEAIYLMPDGTRLIGPAPWGGITMELRLPHGAEE